jgi:MYXO-CTERM domain-containing protein
LSEADIPVGFYDGAGPIALEDFEDGTLDFGITANPDGFVIPPTREGFIDSVDGDDGAIDGSGLGGHSWFHDFGTTGITFTFSGSLPTAAGVVWTDGGGLTSFEAFGPGMVSLGVIGPFALDDGVYTGTTGDDFFFGVQDAGGILAIKLTNSFGGIEADHVQYGRAPVNSVPELSSITLLALGALGAVGAARRRRAGHADAS